MSKFFRPIATIARVSGLLAAVCCSVAGCGEMSMPPAGSYSEVLLVTEEGERSEWTALLTPLIAREHDYYVDKEEAFRVTPIKASEMDEFPAYKNIVICGVFDSSTDVGQAIIRLIGDRGVERVWNEGAQILKREDKPAFNQLTLIVTATGGDALRQTIAERGGEVADVLEASCRERLRRHLLKRQNENVAADLRKRYGFHVKVPSLYRLLSDESGGTGAAAPAGVELIREPPTRILGVYWVDRQKAPTLDDQDELFKIRADYVWKRYDEDQMDRDRAEFAAARLGPHNAIRMSGYWFNDTSVMGGYYETYFVYDDRAELLWAIDLLVLAPGRPKHPLVRELRALAETIQFD
jgi:hypothetical protein